MSEIKTPKHVAIIMDGNGRWAQERFLPRMFGHKNGAEVVRKIVKHSSKRNVEYLTLYAFSSENWNRPEEEVSFLMDLLKGYLEKEVNFLIENNVRLRFIGDKDGLKNDIVDLMNDAEGKTKSLSGLNLTLAINYGSYNEIINSITKVVKQSKENNKEEIEKLFTKNLMTSDIVNPDLLIRTAGEKRLSNFLLWQLAYTELYFTDILWPNFTEKDFDDALEDYSSRRRKYGGINAK